MKATTVAIVGLLGVAAVGGTLYVLARRRTAAATVSSSSPKPAGFDAADILANKTGTNLICKGLSTYYTAGLGNGACGAVAAAANNLTRVQVKATVAVAGAAASSAKQLAVAPVTAVRSFVSELGSIF